MNFILYFDPGLGAMIAQAAIAAFAGFVIFYKTCMMYIKEWLGIKKKKGPDSFDEAYKNDQTDS
ncbi:hypothetical protein [Nonlabens antarcticus]|uniref:hypothetical protein n=1 Tax=Nonlabens antarcticus TaxID=392714 RepID=UPI001891BB4A|nr:hypothetical protein [Nonlabens antarcticus]